LGLEAAVAWIFGASSAAVSRAPAAFSGDLAQESRRSPPSVPRFSRVVFSAIIAAIAGFIAACVKSWTNSHFDLSDWRQRRRRLGKRRGLCAKISFELRLLGAIVFGVRWIAKFKPARHLPVLMSNIPVERSATAASKQPKQLLSRETRSRFWRIYWSFWVAFLKVADEPQTVPD